MGESATVGKITVERKTNHPAALAFFVFAQGRKELIVELIKILEFVRMAWLKSVWMESFGVDEIPHELSLSRFSVIDAAITMKTILSFFKEVMT